MNQPWLWVGKYLLVIAAALVLGAVLGGLEPFHSTTIGSARIGVGTLVQFIAHGGALGLLWAMGYRHAAQLRATSGSVSHLATTVLALTTLVVTASAYAVLLRFTAPFITLDIKMIVDWTFIGAILAAAAWLLWALFVDSEAVIAAIGRAARRVGGTESKA